MTTDKKSLLLLLGVSLVTQATTSLAGGLIGLGPFTDTENLSATMNGIAGQPGPIFIGVFLQVVTAVVIVALAAAFYQATKAIGKTAALVAFGLYLLEAVVHFLGQTVSVAIAEVSKQFAVTGDAALLVTGKLLFEIRDFVGAVTMMPFGVGALLFYFLITKAEIIPRWLGIWGMVTVAIVLVGWSLEAFTVVAVPFAVYIPYVPWEWVAGVYIVIKGLRMNDR